MEQTYLKRAQQLRKESSIAEKTMWTILRNRQLSRYKFRRQYVIHPYIVDFVCLRKKLIIELDGEQHLEQATYDARRTLYLEEQGYKVLRFSNQTWFNKENVVLERIVAALEE